MSILDLIQSTNSGETPAIGNEAVPATDSPAQVPKADSIKS